MSMANADLISMLGKYRAPALVVRDSGHLVAINELAQQALIFQNGGEERLWWEFVRKPQRERLHMAWREGVQARQAFELHICSDVGGFAAPVIHLEGEVGWLILLETSEAGIPTSSRLSPQAYTQPALQTALKAAQLGLWEWDPATDRAVWSAELYDVLRLPRGTGVEPGARFMAMVIPEDMPIVEGIISALHHTGSYSPARLRIRAGDGTVRWLVSCGQRASDHPDSVVVGVNLDITDAMLAAQRLQDAQADSSRQRKIIDSVLEHVPVGIAVTLHDQEALTLVSRYGLDMIECGAQDGMQWDSWSVYDPKTRSPVAKEAMALHRAALGEVIRNEEWLIRRTDGHLLPVCCNAGPILDEAGAIVGGVVAWYDTTPFKDLDRRRQEVWAAEQQARLSAEQANQQKDVFIGIVSHEIRTPLSAILGWTKVLSKDPSREHIERGLTAITRNASALARLVDDLLDITRMAVGKMQMTQREVDLQAVIDAAAESVRGLCDAAGVTLQMERLAHALPVLADPLRLQQALWNLLSNAVKFSQPGGLVQLTCETKGAFVHIVITDFGKGISAEQLQRVFDQFWQAAPDARTGGLGLGLALTKHIVQAHGGMIEAHSAGLGHGSSFTITMPLVT